MIANVFWCGKVHSVTFGQGKEGLTTLGNAIKEFSKIPVSDQVILYHGVAMPTLKASFDVNNKHNYDNSLFILLKHTHTHTH